MQRAVPMTAGCRSTLVANHCSIKGLSTSPSGEGRIGLAESQGPHRDDNGCTPYYRMKTRRIPGTLTTDLGRIRNRRLTFLVSSFEAMERGVGGLSGW